jgi:hypothetical protein
LLRECGVRISIPGITKMTQEQEIDALKEIMSQNDIAENMSASDKKALKKKFELDRESKELIETAPKAAVEETGRGRRARKPVNYAIKHPNLTDESPSGSDEQESSASKNNDESQ